MSTPEMDATSAEDDGSYSQRPFALPPGATEIVFVRHGASANATPGTPFPMVAGRGDPPLAQAGLASLGPTKSGAR